MCRRSRRGGTTQDSHTPRRPFRQLWFGTALLAVSTFAAEPWTAEIWREFERIGTASQLHDFSQAGYKGGKARRNKWIYAEGINRPGVQPPSLYEAQCARRRARQGD